MRDDYFFDGDGQPLTGKIPLQVRFKGSGDPNLIRGHANAALRAFLANVRNSLAPTHRKTIALPNGTMTMWHSYGSTRVEIDLAGGLVQEEEFYGGILVRPQYLPDESVFLTGPVAPAFDPLPLLVPYGEIKTSGQPGGNRPAIPGTAQNVETQWLVVQIAKDKPLGDFPIRDKTVKIYRVPTLSAGDLVELRSTERRYLLSVDTATGVFYLGNKVAQNIPTSLDVANRAVRLCTVGLAYSSLATTDKAEGLVFIVRRDDNDMVLLALDTLARTPSTPAAWVELARQPRPADGMNDFAFTFVGTTEANGVTTATCAGSNGAGVCSSFVVTVQPNPTGRPSLTGTLNLMGSGFVPATPTVVTVNRSITVSPVVANSVSNEMYNPNAGPGNINQDIRFSSVTGTVISDQSGTYTSGTAAQFRDSFLGGYLPTYPPSQAAWTHTFRREIGSGSHVATKSFSYLLGAGETQTWRFESFSEFEWSAQYKWNNGYVDQPTVVTSESGSRDSRGATVVDGSPLPDVVVSTAFNTTVDLSQEFVPDPTARFTYLARDKTTDTRALRLESYQTGRGQSAGGPPTFNASTVTKFFDEASATLWLIDRAGTAIYSWPDLFQLFPVPKPTMFMPRASTATVDYRVMSAPNMATQNARLAIAGMPNASGALNVYPNFYSEAHVGFSRWRLASGSTSVASESLTYSYAGSPISLSGTPAAIGAAFPKSAYALFPNGASIPFREEFGNDISYTTAAWPSTIDVQFTCPAPPAQNAGLSPAGFVGSRWAALYMDPRTEGFIAEACVWIPTTESNGAPVVNAVVSVIGNRFGAQPLQPVIDEWRALGDKEVAFNTTLGQIGPTGDDKTGIVYRATAFSVPTYLL